MARMPQARALPAIAILLVASACGAAGEVSPASPAADGAEVATTAPARPPATTQPTAPATAAGSPAPRQTPPVALEPSEPFATDVVTLRGDGRTVPIAVYIADSPALRARGLMGREDLPQGSGMLFTYTQDSTGTFWMRDTLIPLSIAFFDAAGNAVGILDMEPCTTPICPQYGPDRPYRYALEVPQGWFEEQGIDVGWTLDVPRGGVPQ